MNKAIRAILIVAIAVFLCIFLYSGYRLLSTLHEYKEADRYYDSQVSQYASFHEDAAPQAGSAQGSNTAYTPGAAGAEDPLVALQEISPRVIDFPALIASCPDVKGWLYSPDTVIDYPVVQGKDNDYYLHRFMDGSYNPNGTLFIDFRCAGDFSSPHTLIYGHHMQNGSMFASLEGYRQQAYYDEHPIMYLNTPEGNFRIDLFSAFVTFPDSRVYTVAFENEIEFEQWYSLMKSYSDFQCSIELTPQDQIVTFSTCVYDFDDARYVVLGKLVPIG